TLGLAHVVDGERRLGVVVGDGAGAGGGGDGRDGGVAGGGGEGRVGLELGVAVDQHGHRLRRPAVGRERQRAAGARVVGRRVARARRAVGGGVLDGDGLVTGVAQADGEHERRRAAVALGQRHVVDGEGGLGVVVADGAGAGGGG